MRHERHFAAAARYNPLWSVAAVGTAWPRGSRVQTYIPRTPAESARVLSRWPLPTARCPLMIPPVSVPPSMSRRELLRRLLAGSTATTLWPLVASAQARAPILTRRIPSTGEALPVVGLGSWITFNVGDD